MTATHNGFEERLANGLGWFSIGLGLAEFLAPGKMAEMIGLRDRPHTRTVLRTYGLREIASGVGILSQTQPAGWLWSRVAGDAMDLSSLGAALASDRTERTKVAVATAAVAGVTALDIFCAQKLQGSSGEYMIRTSNSILINGSPEEVYRYWRDFQNLARFMEHLESVRIIDQRRSHWKARTGAGAPIEWDAEIVRDEAGRVIAWRSMEGSEIENSGSVHFERAPGERGTLLRIEMHYAPPGGTVGARLARLFGKVPEQQIQNDLRRFKQLVETGEVVRSDASIHPGMHAAQPPSRDEETVLAG